MMSLLDLSAEEWTFMVVVTVLTILVTLAIPILRDVTKGFFGLLLMPAFSEALKTLSGYLIVALKMVITSHWILIKNIFLPRRLIYRTLEKDEQGVVKR